MLKKLVKRFDLGLYNNCEFANVEGGLVQTYGGIQVPQVNQNNGPFVKAPVYSTSTGLTAKTWIANPKAAKRWLGFAINIKPPKKPDINAATPLYGIQFRITDGEVDFYWDGSDWTEVSLSEHWNSEEEIAQNISSFPVTKIGFVVNMWSTNSKVTPTLQALRVLYEADVMEAYDLLYGSLVPQLKTLGPQGRVLLEMPEDGNAIDFTDLAALGFDTRYTISNIIGAYDYANDPKNLNNLVDSFVDGVLTLTEEFDQGDRIWINFSYDVDVVVQTTSDYIEISKLPRIEITNVAEQKISEGWLIDDWIVDQQTNVGWKVHSPKIVTFRYSLEIAADKQYDAFALRESIVNWIAENGIIILQSMDEPFDIRVDTASFESESSLKNIATYEMDIVIENVALFEKPAVQVYGIEEMNFGGFGNVNLIIKKADFS